LLSHTPTAFLLSSFYEVRVATVIRGLVIDLLSTSIPFYLLRGSSAPHQNNAPRGSVSNRSVISDLPTQIFTSLLAAAVQASIVYGSYRTFLPYYLAVHFNYLRNLTAVYETQFLTLVFLLVPVGIASKVFIFTPSTAAKRDLADIINLSFNPETASLTETVMYNLWGYSKRSRVNIQRTLTAAIVTSLFTWLQLWGTVEGVEGTGATVWASIWGVGTIAIGAIYWWITDINEVSN
jgi:hypothetical protein